MIYTSQFWYYGDICHLFNVFVLTMAYLNLSIFLGRGILIICKTTFVCRKHHQGNTTSFNEVLSLGAPKHTRRDHKIENFVTLLTRQHLICFYDHGKSMGKKFRRQKPNGLFFFLIKFCWAIPFAFHSVFFLHSFITLCKVFVSLVSRAAPQLFHN